MLNKLIKSLTFIAALAVSSIASASLINGELGLNFTGTLNTAADTFAVSTSTASVVTGDFTSYISVGDAVTFAPATLDYSQPFSQAINFSVGGFTFDILNLVLDFENASTAVLNGYANATGNGFDATPMNVLLTLNKITQSGEVSPVPAPGSLALLGLGLVGLGAARRKQKA